MSITIGSGRSSADYENGLYAFLKLFKNRNQQIILKFFHLLLY